MRAAAYAGCVAVVLLASAEEGSHETGCTITVATCKNFPDYQRTQFRDATGEAHLGTASNEAACLKRAEDFHHWCGNTAKSGAQVAATYNQKKLSQLYHPGACDEGWSQWDAFCFRHYWEKRNWFEAEALCRQRNAHLASVHSQAENRFIYTLTRGLSAWIGYTDIDQDTHYKWSDNTQDDFTNFAKNCTGREDEPDCKPEERQQQWYDWEGGDKGTFVCKRNALVPMALLRNVSSWNLTQISWGVLLPVLAGNTKVDKCGTDTGVPCLASPSLKTPEIPTAPVDASTKNAKPFVPQPKFALPKGSLL